MITCLMHATACIKFFFIHAIFICKSILSQASCLLLHVLFSFCLIPLLYHIVNLYDHVPFLYTIVCMYVCMYVYYIVVL